MTVSSGFFNSINHDRLYDAEQISSIFDGIIEDGVYESIGDAFMVTPNQDTENSIVVGTGRAWFDHTWTLNDTSFTFTLDPPSTIMGRIDMVVIDVDRRDSVRANSIKLLTGSYAEQPVAPTLINEDLHKQYPIATINRNAGSDAMVSQSNITYLVGTDECPLVIGVLDALNIQNYLQQYNAEFEEWFQGIKDIFGDENPAFHFQEQLDNLDNKIDSLIPFATKNVFDAYLDNKAPITISSTNINDNFLPSTIFNKQYLYHSFEGTGYYLLPDGKPILIKFNVANNSKRGVQNYGVCAIVFGEDGTVISSQEQDLGAIWTLYWGREDTESDYKYSAPFCLLHVDNEAYPAKFLYGLIGNAYDHEVSGCPRFFAKSIVVTVTSDLTISFSVTTNTNALDSTDMNDDRRRGCGTCRIANFGDGRHVGLVSASEWSSSGGAVIRAVSITTDGTISCGPKLTVPHGGYGPFYGAKGVAYIPNSNDAIILDCDMDADGNSGDYLTKDTYNFRSDTGTAYENIKYRIDVQTLAILKQNYSGKGTVKFDSLWDLDYYSLHDGKLDKVFYDHLSSSKVNSSESFRSVNLASIPTLLQNKFAVVKIDNSTDVTFIGFDTIKGNPARSTIYYTVGKAEGTGITFSKQTGFFYENSSFKYYILPYTGSIKNIGNDIYVIVQLMGFGNRDGMGLASTQTNQPEAKLIKITIGG